MRERLISAPLLAFYWWVREFPLEKSPADLRLESRLWAIAGRRDLARFCRLRAEVLEHPAGNGRRGRPRYSDAVALIGVAALVAVTVLVIVVDVSRWWFV